MFQLVYASTASRPFTDDELFEMLGHFRAKNARLGITGLLLYKEGAFMQLLEGDEVAVHSLYAEICADDRHHHVSALLTIPVAERQFPDWSMGFKHLTDAVGTVQGYKPIPTQPPVDDELSWKATVAMKLLATFNEHK